MDIITTPPYEEMQRIYTKYFSLGNLNTNLNTRFALISLLGYLTYKLKKKKPDVTPYRILRKILDDTFPEDIIKGISVVCEDFCYNCTEYPLFGLEDKQIPAKIKEIMTDWLPF